MTIGFHKVSGPDFTLHPAPNWLPQQDASFCLDPAPTQLQPGAALNPKGIAATPSRFGRDFNSILAPALFRRPQP
ncbi:gamma-tubulin complex component 6 [Corchorus olitorius]|uniref:Gamma-tubulin complex component 6 n=1 Tax=Corchorus olitorius TaxID=93759 RepID=A0A1R3GEN8_9ROSI|nr:gamma-tubulin complex component 6 [Corchorus olitorius]